jgi:diguanylate cyclase (GGDEF)-like protein
VTRQLVTLFYIDLDGFKPVNDELGHDAGDELLATVGRRLTACVRAGDTVARLGGDEFAVLLAGHAEADDARAMAARLADVFANPFVIRGSKIGVTASIGSAAFPSDADSADTLLRWADTSMFEVKREHRAAPIRRRSRSRSSTAAS